MANAVHSISIPSSTRHLGKVRRFVERYAIEAEFPEKTVNSLQLAVDEACANIIEHAYAGSERKAEGSDVIDIDVIIKPDRFIVRIRDHGRAFETKNYSAPNILKFARTRKAGGFGVHLMRQLMDQVEYRTRGNSNECCLIKYRVTQEVKVNRARKKATTRSKATTKSKAKANTKAKTKTRRKSTPAKKSAPKKAALKKSVKKSVKKSAKKSSAKKTTSTKVAARKTATKRATKKVSATRKSTRKVAASNSARKKSTAKKSTAKKTVSRKSTTKKLAGKQSAAKGASKSAQKNVSRARTKAKRSGGK